VCSVVKDSSMRRIFVFVLCSFLMSSGAAQAADEMNAIAERYVHLVLAVGQHDPDYVDAFYGPAEWKTQGIDLDEFRHVKRWFEELSERPAVQRGMAVTVPELDPTPLSPEEKHRLRKLLMNQRARPAPG